MIILWYINLEFTISITCDSNTHRRWNEAISAYVCVAGWIINLLLLYFVRFCKLVKVKIVVKIVLPIF